MQVSPRLSLRTHNSKSIALGLAHDAARAVRETERPLRLLQPAVVTPCALPSDCAQCALMLYRSLRCRDVRLPVADGGGGFEGGSAPPNSGDSDASSSCSSKRRGGGWRAGGGRLGDVPAMDAGGLAAGPRAAGHARLTGARCASAGASNVRALRTLPPHTLRGGARPPLFGERGGTVGDTPSHREPCPTRPEEVVEDEAARPLGGATARPLVSRAAPGVVGAGGSCGCTAAAVASWAAAKPPSKKEPSP